MGAHSASGHLPGRTLTATAGIAAAVVTTATTGVLTGGTALATDGHGGSGHSHDGDHSRSGHHSSQLEDASPSSPGFAQQTLCDVLGDVDLGGSCSSDGGSSQESSVQQQSSSDDGTDATDQDPDDGVSSPGLLGSAFPGQSGQSGGQTSAPQTAPEPAPAPKPAPTPTSSVPDKPTVQPITAAPSTSKITG